MKTNQEESDIIKLWKENKIQECVMNFSCGGDSMGDYNFEFYDTDGKEVRNEDLVSYFENAVFDKVDFYVNSDGHYIGESGVVRITLDEDENDFSYSKEAESEYSEQFTETASFELTKTEKDFLNEFVSNINGDDSRLSMTVNYKKDFIMTEEQSEMLEEFKDKLHEFVDGYEVESDEGEPEDFFTYTTGDNLGLEFKENALQIEISKSVRVYKSE